MYLVALGWLYVVLMMAVAEAMAPSGTLLGAAFTFLLYGALPLSIVLYLMGTPARRRARRRAETLTEPDRGGLPPGDPVAPERKEP